MLRFFTVTIYLLYNKGLKPKGITNYLIVEATGNYFIQYFTNGRKRLFLKTKLWMVRMPSKIIQANNCIDLVACNCNKSNTQIQINSSTMLFFLHSLLSMD